MTPPEDLSELSMEQLFQLEAETQCTQLSDGLVALETAPDSPELLANLMRAAHSLKGAARILGYDEPVQLTHAMEDCFVLAQAGTLTFTAPRVDLMLRGVDLLRTLAAGRPVEPGAVANFLHECGTATRGGEQAAPTTPMPAVAESPTAPGRGVNLLRVGADKLDRLLGFAGEGVVAARQLDHFQRDLRVTGQRVRLAAARLPSPHTPPAESAARLGEYHAELDALSATLLDQHAAFEAFTRRVNLQADHLYNEALTCRMLPLSDLLPGLRRLVRDLARELGKHVSLEVVGEDTPVDREILERLDAPLAHLLRNALDHGIESPAERLRAGKPETAQILLEARHVGGHLVITVQDDGGGIDVDRLRVRIVQRGMTTEETAGAMSEAEVLEFLFLPGFSMRDAVTEISGRGVGLDAVQSMARSVRGSVRALPRPGRGLAFELRLPISLSVLRSLLVTIAGEFYAFPLARLSRALAVPSDRIESVEGRPFFSWDGHRVPLARAAQIFGFDEPPPGEGLLRVLLIEQADHLYGVIVDAFCGEQDLVVQPLDPALGKIPGIASASLAADGDPVLIADVDDLVVSLERLASEGKNRVAVTPPVSTHSRRLRVLVVEDSLTVRELERKLLLERGYEVEVAVDGIDGWTALRGTTAPGFDLVITDVDMPRLDGIELTTRIKADPRLRSIPVMIVSYKDREEDRRRGLEAGADYYLTKGSFQDRTLIHAVRDLIGEPE